MQKNNSVWQSSLDVNNPNLLQAWLNHRGSFIERLAHHGIHQPRIDVIREGWLQPEIWECALLGLAYNDSGFIREVRIGYDDQVWLYARTVVPEAMLTSKKELASLDTRSLGSVLFQDPNIKRDQFEFIYAEPSKLWQGFSPVQDHPASWIRRSLFHLHDTSLLLTEIFRSDLMNLCRS